MIKIGTGVSIGAGYTLNPTTSGVIDLNGQTVGAASVTGDSSGTIKLNGGVLEFTNSGTVTIDSGEAVISGPGIIRLTGEGQVRFNQDPTRCGTDQITFNGEFRVDGVAGTADTFLISAPIINLGDGFATTGGTGSQSFPRLYLVNTETTQTSTLNVNGGWITSDLGDFDATIWSGPINFTGTADTNIFDVNDAGGTLGDQHAVTGVIGGTGGFSKVNTGTLRLEANNTIQGDIYIQRNGVGGTNIDSTASRGGIRLTAADGALSAANSVVISRDGSFYLNNATDVNNDRVGDTTGITLRGQGRIRLVGNATSAVSETMGALYVDTGSGKINFDIDDTTPQLTTMTFASFKRDPGSIAQFQVLDDLTGSFGSPFAGSVKAQLFIADAGATANTAVLYGGGGVNGSTNKTLVIGAYGGVNNISNHFMTFDSTNTTELRPLVWDGTPVGSEYFLSREAATLVAPHQFTRAGLVTNDQNVLINFNTAVEGDVGTGLPGSASSYGWYGNAPIAILENVAMNSLRFGTNTPTNGANSNEIGSALVLAPGARLFLGDHADDGVIGDITTSGSGMILFGRDISGTAPGSNQYIAGGYIDFGSREAIIVNESGNSAFLRSNIVGTGGLTKAGAQSVYLDNSNSYTGVTNVAEGALIVRDQNALGGSPLVRVEGAGSLYLELGTNVHNSIVGTNPLVTGPPPSLFVGTLDTTRVVLYSNNSNNSWDGDVIIDTVDNLGNWVFTPRISTNARDTLNINGDIYSNEVGSAALTALGIAEHQINADTALNDARLVSTGGGSSTGGIININGQFSDNVNGPVSAPVTAENENQVLRFQIGGSNEMIVNVRQKWNAAGQIRVEQGILRYEGDGNFWTPLAAERMDSTNGQSGLRIGGSYNGTNNGTQNAAVILTKPGQVLNIGRIDIGGDGSNNYNAFGNTMLAGTNTSGTVTFGDGTERVYYYGATSSRRFVRDLTVYAAGGGTVELNYRLDDTDADSHTSFTKIGRGVVNFNGQNDVNGAAQNGDVEQLNMSGGLLRLTNYGHATGRRFDNGAMITLAGGGIEMDGAGAIQNETANYTGAAVVADAAYPTAQTLIAPGGTDVIVTAADFNITMNIGADAIPLTRLSGGTVNFVENATGSGNAVITLEGSGQPGDGTAIAWATYGNSYAYNAAAATYTLNALDFAMTSNAGGDIDMFSGASRQDEDAVADWVLEKDVSENVAGFSGATVIASVNTIHFDFDGMGVIDATAGLEVTGGGVMVSSSVITGEKMISNGTLNAGIDTDLIIHQYGGADMTISSVIQNNAGSAAGNALVKTGSGNLVLNADNTYTGGTYLNGGQLTISSNTNLGLTPVAEDADNIYANGGTLRVLADVNLDANRGMTLGGNGVEVSVGPSATLTFNGVIASEPNVIAGYTANPAVGRFDKTGSGTLLLTNVDNTFNGLFDIRAGTVKWEPLVALSNGTYAPFGSNNAFLDGTIVHSGATLAIHPLTAATNSNNTFTINEWFTFEGGSTLDLAPVSNATTPHDFNLNLRGVLKFDSLGNAGTPDGFVTPTSLAGATVIDVGRRQTNLNDDGGYITGDGGITKTGDSTLAFRENSPEWTGQLVVLEGAVYVYGAGDVLGKGTLPIILGHNLLAEQAGEVVSGNTQVHFFHG
ncbi:MAG: autotransporter-associated beta strand repeat-containing protein [Prosthecobacter sp.]